MVEHEAVTNFRKYLQIPSVHPNINYDECVKFLKEQAEGLGLPVRVYEEIPRKPVVVITYEGTSPELQSILLNSHMDVVPVYQEKWIYPPFSAYKDGKGNIYARGSQDMKCVGIWYIEAIRRFIKEGLKFKRTIHVSFVPDEEIGGREGMGLFVKSEAFEKMNIGCALDEGLASTNDSYYLFNGDRYLWGFEVICPGTSGHGSTILQNTAGEKIRRFIESMMDFRESERQKLLSNPKLSLGDVTTVNLTMLSGGVQLNVLPEELRATFDLRVAVDAADDVTNKLDEWCKNAGEGVHINFKRSTEKFKVTKLDSCNKWWTAFKDQSSQMGMDVVTGIFPARSDASYIRQKNISAFGFSPINNTERLLHDHNEYLSEEIFLKGIDIYYHLIKSLASVQ